MTPDEYYMFEALKEAKKAYAAGEVPVGAVLVSDQKIIARAHNQVESLRDATAHAEIIAISSGAATINNWRLLEATLYCTLEPCAMCAGAMFSARLKRLVWGAPDHRVGANGSWIDLFSQKHPIHTISVTQKVLENESSELLRLFFQKRRELVFISKND